MASPSLKPEVAARLAEGRRAILRSSLTLLIEGHEAEDVVGVLAGVVSDHATAVARRTGDYHRASQLSRLSDRIDLAIDEPEEPTR